MKLEQLMQEKATKKQNGQFPRWPGRRGLPSGVIFILIFLLAFLPRAIHPISWPMQWYERSIHFSDAVLKGDWAGTFERHHPGVTTCWLSGFGLQAFACLRGLTSAQLLGAEPAPPAVVTQAMVAGVLPLAFTIALCIALSYFTIRRLTGPRVALAAAGLLALDPFYIARSQVLHVDALMATFMLVSALLLLDYLHPKPGTQNSKLKLMLSGVFGGMAMLSKSPALFLVPYTAMVMGVHQLTKLDERPSGWRGWANWLGVILQNVLLWCLVAAVVFVALWPAMWVQPMDVLDKMTQRVTSKVENPHYNPVFFNGQIVFEDPGPLFYLATLVWRTTPITLLMMSLALIVAVFRSRRNRRDKLTILLLVAYVIFFTTQMCLGARKEMRYILAAFPAIDVIAAFGVVWTAEMMAKVRWLSRNSKLETQGTYFIIVGALALQATLILPRHPYYGTIYNQLLGGVRKAQHVLPLQHEGEGLDLAAQYLNTLPHAQRASVGVHQRGVGMIRRYFIGQTTTLSDPKVDYRVYFVNQVMRRLDIEAWEKVWAVDQQTIPLWKIAFNGVTYVWVYEGATDNLTVEGPEYDLNYQLGDHVQLKRIKLSSKTLAPGESLIVAPFWESDGQLEKSYKVFCHLLRDDQEVIAQRDDFPIKGSRLTSTWQAGEVIEDSYVIHLDDDIDPGEYELSIGMYDPESMERLPAYDASGEQVHNNRIVVGKILIKVKTQ